MSIILSKKLEDEVLKDNFPSSFSIEPQYNDFFYRSKTIICLAILNHVKKNNIKHNQLKFLFVPLINKIEHTFLWNVLIVQMFVLINILRY